MRSVPLKHVAQINRSVLSEDTPADTAFRYIDISSVTGTGEVEIPDEATTFAGAPSRARRLAPCGATVVSTVRTYLRAIARVPETDDSLVFSTGFAVLEATEAIDPGFLYYACRSDLFVDEVVARSTGVSYPAITASELGSISVALPSLEEQRRIAAFLDDQVMRLDQAIRLRDEQQCLLIERRDSMVARALSASAATVPLRRVVARWIDYRGATPEKTSSGVPLVTAKNIRNGIINLAVAEEYIAEGDYDAWMRRGLPAEGDVLLTTEAPLGEVAQVVDSHIALAQRVILLRPLVSRLHARWLYWFLRSPQGSFELWSRATGTTAQGIKAERLRDVPIPLPPRDEQIRRLGEIEQAEREWHVVTPLLEKGRVLLQERKQALITAAVTGRVDVTTARGAA